MAGETLWSAPGLGTNERFDPGPEGAGFRFTRPYYNRGGYGSQGGRRIGPPYAGNQQQQFAQGGSDLLSTIGQIMAQRRNDSIRQRLLEQELSNRPDLRARYAQAGLTGQAAYDQMNDDLAAEQQDTTNEIKRRLIEAQITHLNAPASDNSVPITVNDPSGGSRTIHVTPDAALRHLDSKSPVQKARDKWDAGLQSKYGFGADDLDEAEQSGYLSTPGQSGGIQYVDAAGLPVDTSVAYKDPGSYRAVGTIGDAPLDIPLPQWLGIRRRHQALARSPDNGTQPSTAPQNQAPTAPAPKPTAPAQNVGAGPPDDAIAHLRANPELASEFDRKYGAGMADTYLTP